MARLTFDECVSLTVGQLVDRLKAEGPAGLSEVGSAFRFGFLMTTVRRFLLGETDADREDLERALLLVMDAEQCEEFLALKKAKGL